MRQDCRKRVSKALGRPITDQEVAAIDRGMRRSMRHLAQTNPDWKGMSREERLIAAGDHAGEQFVQAPAPVQPKQRISPLANLVTPDDALNQEVYKGDDVVVRRAQNSGFEGSDLEGALEWEAAKAKGLDMSQEARMERAKKMGFDTETTLYHGTGNLDAFEGGFDPSITGQGNDQYGSGFYLTTAPWEASGYTTRTLSGTPKLGGETAPGVLPVYAKIKNPIRLNLDSARNLDDADITLTPDQVKSMMKSNPDLMDMDNSILGDWYNIWDEGIQEWMIDELAQRYADSPLSHIEGDLFRGRSTLFRAQLSKQTGFDGVIMDMSTPEFGEKIHYIPWFPEQIRSVNAAFDPDHADSANLLHQKTKNPSGWGPVTPPPNIPPVRLDLKAVRDFYGDEAVTNLPRDVRERAATTDSVESMLGVIDSVRDTLKGKRPRTLLGFLRSRKISGVADPDGELTRILEGAEGSRGVINNKSGMDLDYVREAAEEAGYITPTSEDGRTTIQDLLDAIEREVQGDPVYMPQDLERASQIKDAETWAEWLDENDVDIYAEDKAELTRQVENLISISQEGAVTPDQAAELFGFPTGEDLLNAMTEQGGREQAVRRETTRRFKEEFGDMYETGELQAEIDRAVQTELRARKADIELEALSRAVGVQAAKRYAKDMAQSSLEMMSIGELRKRHKGFRRSAETHGRNALSEAKKGNWTESMRAKRYEMVALQMYLEGEKRLEMADRIQKDLRKYETSKGRRDRIANDYLEKIDALLEAYELRTSKQGDAEKRRRLSALEWVTQMKDEGREAEIAPEAELLAAAANDKRFVDLRIDEAEYLHATIKNIAHLGRTKERLLNDQEKRKFNAVIDDLVDALDEAGPLGNATRGVSPRKTRTEKAVGFLRTSHAWLMRLEHQFRALDGKANGPLWNALFRIFADAADVESKMQHESAKAVREAYNIYSAVERHGMHNTSISLPELGPSPGKRWTKMDVLSMALNWGVQYNRDALLEGYGWEAAQVEAMLERVMTDKDWDFVEAVWAESGKYKEEAFALEKEMTGVEPKAVEGMTFTLASGRVIEGKYYHLEYDSEQPGSKSRRQQRQDEREALSERGRSMTKPMTRNGALKERVGSGGKPVKLHISVFERSLAETIHDIAYRRAVIDATKIVQNDRFADAYEAASGKEAYNQLMPWLDAIAKPPMQEVQGYAKYFVTLRRNLPISYMGYKVGTALIQVSGLLAAVPEIGLHRVAGGFAKAMTGGPLSVISAWQAVSEKSEFMRDRPMGYDRDVREITTAMGADGPLNAMRQNAFILISAMDIAVSTPVWIAAYDKALDGKVDGVEAANENDAIAYADSVVRRTQTAGRTQDLARVSRDAEFWKQLTMIYGYFSGLYGLTAQQVRATRTGEQGYAQFAWYMTMLFVAVPVVAELLSGRLIPDDDDDETLVGNTGRTVASNFAGMFPVLRDMVNYQLKPQYGYNMSPVASGAGDVAQMTTMLNDGEVSEAEVKNAVRAIGALTGLPASQLVITGDYFNDLLNGVEEESEGPLDSASEMLLRDTR